MTEYWKSLEGSILNKLVVEEFWYKDQFVEPIKFHVLANNVWYQLYFDAGEIFWKSNSSEPKSWDVPDEEWKYRTKEIKEISSLQSRICEFSCKKIVGGKCECTIKLESGHTLVFKNENDSTNYET